jgi:opacity protein-like surface antigen
MQPMKKIAALTLVGLAMASTPTQAADLFGTAPPPMSAPDSPMVEVGSNWYIRGDVGASLDEVPDVSLAGYGLQPYGVPPIGTAASPLGGSFTTNVSKTDFNADVGIGYRFNNWFRADVTYDYRKLPGASTSNTVGCPNSLTTLYNEYTTYQTSPTGAVTPINVSQPLGYLYNPGTKCNGNLTVNQQSNMGLVTGYADLGTWWGVTPYVGAGIGMNATQVSGSITYVNASDGSTYNANLTPASSQPPTIAGGGATPTVWLNPDGTVITPQPKVSFSQQNWNRTISSVKYGVAYALTAGFGYQLTPSATLDLSYRYLNTGAPTTISIDGATVKQENYSQQFRIGVRYMID